jgi:hypothetical protein
MASLVEAACVCVCNAVTVTVTEPVCVVVVLCCAVLFCAVLNTLSLSRPRSRRRRCQLRPVSSLESPPRPGATGGLIRRAWRGSRVFDPRKHNNTANGTDEEL